MGRNWQSLRLLVWALTLTGCAAGKNGVLPFEIVRHQRAFFFDEVPPRRAKAMSGRQFLQHTRNAPPEARELYALKEILQGNVPNFNRRMKAITYKSDLGDTITLWVMPDYLAIGSNHDYVRMPLNPMTAQRVADAFSCLLPTPKIVDEIYKAAELKLKPRPIRPSRAMIRNGYFLRHQKLIERQPKAGEGTLVAGHKKDVVITNRLLFRPNRVAIYGWHDAMEVPIQPLSLIHHNHYADYSHGIRLIYKTALVNGEAMELEDVMKDLRLYRLVSYEGLVLQPRVQLTYLKP